MTFSDKLKSAWYELMAPEKQELLNDVKKLEKNINNIPTLQKSIDNLIEKINISKTWKERYILEEQLEELQKLNTLYKKYKNENFTNNTKKEIKILLNWISSKINLKENKLEYDSLKLANIIANEEDKLEDTLDIISPNTIRDTVEKYIDIKWELESKSKEKYQRFFDIATITYIDLLEKLNNKNIKFNKKQIDFLSKNKWLYLDWNSIHIYIKELIKKLNNANLDFEFKIQLNKVEYNKVYNVNLEKYKKNIEKNKKIKLAKEKEIEEKKILEEKEKNYVLDEATNLIIRHEWFSKISKWDKKQYSWWYWTKAPWKGLIINKLKAKIELKNKILKTKQYVEKYFPNITKDQTVALISFFFNTWTSSKWKENLIWRLKNMNKHVKWIWIIKPESVANMIVKYTNSWWKELDWLITRREEEKKYFLKR